MDKDCTKLLGAWTALVAVLWVAHYTRAERQHPLTEAYARNNSHQVRQIRPKVKHLIYRQSDLLGFGFQSAAPKRRRQLLERTRKT